jgi:hypothetical protein
MLLEAVQISILRSVKLGPFLGRERAPIREAVNGAVMIDVFGFKHECSNGHHLRPCVADTVLSFTLPHSPNLGVA